MTLLENSWRNLKNITTYYHRNGKNNTT